MIDLKDYCRKVSHLLTATDFEKLEVIARRLCTARQSNGRLILFGNGASCSLAAHAALDFTKQAGLTSLCFHDPSLLTAFSNDFGYENAFSKILTYYRREGDIIMLISVSGESPNILDVATAARALGHHVISLTGNYSGNTLHGISDLGLCVESKSYNIVESVHTVWLTSLIDYLVGTSDYDVK